MIEVIIIEYSRTTTYQIEQHLIKYYDKVKVMGRANNIKDGIDLLNTNKVDLLFLATHLKDGLGFEVLKNLDSKSFEVIFLCPKDELTIKTFEYANMLYLINPITEESFNQTFNQYLEQLPTKKKFPENLETKKNHCEIIGIPTIKGYKVIELRSIYYLEADSSYTNIHLEKDKVLVSSNSLKKFEQFLEPTKFCRIHDKYIVNLLHIVNYNKGRGGSITLRDQKSLPVSIRKKSHFLSKINIKPF